MELRNLVTFIHVAELGSFTKAAEVLGYSQSTISFQIKQLETELGCLLFERINHAVSLTEKGSELISYAHKIRLLTDELRDSLEPAKSPRGHVHIVAPDSICAVMISELYLDFHARFPDISLRFSTADTADMLAMIDRNEADLAITLDVHNYDKNYVIAKEEPIKTHFVTNASSPLLKKRNLSIKDIISEPFVLTEYGQGYRRALDTELTRRSLEISPVLEFGRTDVISELLKSNNSSLSFV